MKLDTVLAPMTLSSVATYARAADQMGFDWFSVSDHFQESPPRGGDMDCYEAITTLTAAAVETKRVRLGSGEFFGEMALLSGRPRQADVVALTYCRLLVLRKADFERFLTANPDAKAEINRIVEARLSANQEDGDRTAATVSN